MAASTLASLYDALNRITDFSLSVLYSCFVVFVYYSTVILRNYESNFCVRFVDVA